MAYAERRDAVVVIGGGVAGTQAAAELAQMGHHVDLVERRPFLGGRAARIGTVFPTNDCGQCLPTTDAQAGTRKCFHRNVAIDHPDLTIWRRATVESVSGRPGDFEVGIRRLPNIVTDACVNCGTCETVCPVESVGTGQAGHLHRVLRRPCRSAPSTWTPAPSAASVREECPVEAIDFTQSPQRATVQRRRHPHGHRLRAGAGRAHQLPRLWARRRRHPGGAGGDAGRLGGPGVPRADARGGGRDGAVRRLARPPAPAVLLAPLLHDRAQARHPPEDAVPQDEGHDLLPRDEDGRRGLRELVPRGAPGGRRVPARHAARGAVRRRRPAGDRGRGRDRRAQARPAPRPRGAEHRSGADRRHRRRIAQTLGVDRDEDGFIEILDRKNRATETTAEGMFVCGSAAGPKALIEVNTEASAVASEIHNFLTSAGRRSTPASLVDAARVRRLRHLHDAVPLRGHHAAGATGGRAAPGRGEGRRQARRHRRRGLPRLRHLRRQLPRGGRHPQPQRRRPVRAHRADDGGRGEADRRLLLQGVRRRRHRSERPTARPVPRGRCGSSSCPAWGE